MKVTIIKLHVYLALLLLCLLIVVVSTTSVIHRFVTMAAINTFCGMHFNHYRPFAVKMENIKRKGTDIDKWLGIEKSANEKD